MGISEKHQAIDVESEPAKKWMIAGIPLRAPLKPVFTSTSAKPAGAVERRRSQSTEREDCSSSSSSSTTPKGEESRIPPALTCPPAPRKRKATRSCNYDAVAVREFFNPPDLDTVFTTIRHELQRAS